MITRTLFTTWRLSLATFGLAGLLVGCNEEIVAGIDGGGRPEPVASASVGTITGLGSVIVNGKTFDTSAATIRIDGRPGTEADLRIGQIVTIEYDASNNQLVADSVATRDVVEGRIEAVDLASNSVLLVGQNIALNADTIFDGNMLSGGPDLAPGMVIEVSGFTSAAGDISATRVEEKSDSDEFEVTGRITGLNEGAMTLVINSLMVDYSAAVLVNFDEPISDGDLVEVSGDQFNGGIAVVTTVEHVGPSLPDELEELELEGLITRFVSASDFDLQGVSITTDAGTSYSGGNATNLALNVKLEVEGSINANGILVADSIEFRAASSAKIEAYVSAADAGQDLLEVFSIPVDFSVATKFKDEGPLELREFSLADVNVGDFIEIIGEENAGRIMATLVKRKSPEDKLILKGLALNLNAPNLEVLGVAVVTNGATDFEDSVGGSIDAGAFFAVAEGQAVEVQGDAQGNALLAAEIELED